MEITIYHNPNCSKSRKTLEIIKDAGENPTVVEYLVEPPDKQTIRNILDALGITAKELVRTKESEFAELNLGSENANEEAIIDAMVTHPILIERPIVIAQGKAVIGRPPENVHAIIG